MMTLLDDLKSFIKNRVTTKSNDLNLPQVRKNDPTYKVR